MFEPSRLSPFSEPVAVDAWDAWFRWREHGRLYDVSIDDTWRRVAGALASVEAEGEQAEWLARFVKALASWQLLPDARVLSAAGTGRVTWRDGALQAAVNAAAFVSVDGDRAVPVDPAAMSQCAEVAVRALDNAAVVAGALAPRLRIGLAGVADALALLDYGYDSDAGRTQVARWAAAIAEGCFRASTQLAIERGPAQGDTRGAIQRALVQGLAPEWIQLARRRGLRHQQLTAITAQPRLALLANDVADALDPLLGEHHARAVVPTAGQCQKGAAGYALNLLRGRGDALTALADTLASLPWIAQIKMRAAVQPWMDEPIAYPLLLQRDPDSREAMELLRQAALHGLGTPTWRVPAALACGTNAGRLEASIVY